MSIAINDEVMLATGLGRLYEVSDPALRTGPSLADQSYTLDGQLGVSFVARVDMVGAKVALSSRGLHLFGSHEDFASGVVPELHLEGPSAIWAGFEGVAGAGTMLFVRGRFADSTQVLQGFDLSSSLTDFAPATVSFDVPLLGGPAPRGCREHALRRLQRRRRHPRLPWSPHDEDRAVPRRLPL